MISICSLTEETVFLPPIFHVNVRRELLCRFWQVMDVLSAAPILEKLVQTILGVIYKQTLHCGCVDETATIQSLIGIQEVIWSCPNPITSNEEFEESCKLQSRQPDQFKSDDLIQVLCF
jgi:hypothetical protein